MSAARKTIRAVIYARISQDDSGTAEGVGRQIDDARALAESRGWEVVETYTDNDVSAYSGARRPGYQSLMAAVEAGEVDRIVVYMTSRLWRSRKERAGAMETLERLRVGVAAVSGPELDFTTASGRMVAGILGEFDTAESAIKSERVARAAEQRAQQGRPSGGLGYGWRKGDDGSYVLDDAAAEVVREVVARLTAGESLRGLTDDLNARGIPAPGTTHRRQHRRPGNDDGALWGESGVRKIALRPSNAALRVHRGEVVGGAAWPAIITEAEHRKVTEVLSDPRRMRNGGTAVRRHLLTYGIGRCGVCGARLRVSVKGGHALYVCDARSGCVGRRQERVDEFVEAVVIERLRKPDAASLFTPHPTPGADADALRRAESLRARLDDAATLYASGTITADQLATITANIRPDLDDAERQAARPVAGDVPTSVRKMTGKGDPAKVWASLDVNGRRDVLEALGMTVTIHKTKQGPGFDPESVSIGWGRNV